MGNGRSININLDNWIPDIGIQSDWHHEDLKHVSDLIDETGNWDHDLIDTVFNAEVERKIKSIYINVNSQDRLRWLDNKNGEFLLNLPTRLSRKSQIIFRIRFGPSFGI